MMPARALGHGGAAMVGLYGVVGVVGRIAGRIGLRVDASHRKLHINAGHFLGVTVISVSLTSIPRAAPRDTMP